MSFPAATRNTTLICLSACAFFLATFGVLSTVSVLHKSATYDEPMHALAGWIHRQFGDYRMNFEDPPLWQRWATLSSGRETLSPDFASPAWKGMAENSYLQWSFAGETLFGGGAMNDGVSFISRTRAMMVPIGVALGVLIAAWAWRLAGPIAGVVAVALFALDPNFIGHTPLVKNDVAIALMTAAVVAATWSVGRRVTILNAAALAFLTGMAINVKFSAVLLGPIVLTLLVIRAVVPAAWPVFHLSAAKVGQRLLAAVLLCMGIAVVSIITTWACYGFRFGPANDPAIAINTNAILKEAIADTYRAKSPLPPTAKLDDLTPTQTLLDRFSASLAELEAEREKLSSTAGISSDALPQLATDTAALQSELGGLVPQLKTLASDVEKFLRNAPPTEVQSDSFKAQSVQARTVLIEATNRATRDTWSVRMLLFWRQIPGREPDAFSKIVGFALGKRLLPSPWLNGMLFVHARSQLRGSYLAGERSLTGFRSYFPLAIWFKTPVATLLTLAAAFVIGAWALSLKVADRVPWTAYWPVVCLILPAAIYLASVMSSNLNIGFRHVLPVYPFVYVIAGIVAAYSVRQFGPWTFAALATLGVTLLLESVAVWPNGIAYFNLLHGGPRGGLKLLADSNLDWGQDFPALAKWQVQNPNLPVALSFYQGVVSPAAYGVRAAMLPPGPISSEVRKQYVIAIGATNLQGVYDDADTYAEFRDLKPLGVLNGTIYLYDLRPKSK